MNGIDSHSPTEPWGKLDRRCADRARAPRLSPVAHCIDVAAVMDALLALPTLQERLAALAEAGVGPRALQALADSLGGPWPEHGMAMTGQRSAQAAAALPVPVQWNQPWGRAGWSELGDEARTRLGLDGIDLDLRCPGPRRWCDGPPLMRSRVDAAWRWLARADALRGSGARTAAVGRRSRAGLRPARAG